VGRALRNALFPGLASCLVVWMPGFAAAEPVTVIRGGQVTVVDTGRDPSAEEPREVAPAAARERSSEALPRLPTAPGDEAWRVVIVWVESSPQIAWELVTPWERRGIRIHEGADGRRPWRIVTHRAPTARVASAIRVHGTGGERSNPWAIRTRPLGGDESRIKVHGGRSRGWSRSRGHGVASFACRKGCP
jgi:hypothetical protein